MPHPTTKEWTVMFYFASDNPLAPSIISQLKAIKDAGFHPEANVIAHFDPHTPNTPTHVFDVNYLEKLKAFGGSQVGHANDPSVRNLVLDKLWGNDDKDKDIRRQISELLSEPLRKSLDRSRNGNSTNGSGTNGNGTNGNGAGGSGTATTVTVTTAGMTAATTAAVATATRAAKKAAPTVVALAGEAVMKKMIAQFERPDFGLPILGKAVGLNGEAHPSDSLKDFLLYCKKAYPARHYILFLLGHGLVVGNKMFMLDEHSAPSIPRPDAARDRREKKVKDTESVAPATPQEEVDISGSLTLQGLSCALDAFNNLNKDAGQLELIGFHSCSMSGLEVAYQLQGKARYMMASQGPAFVGSWPYRQILIRLYNNLNGSLRAEDLTDAPALMSKLKDTTSPLAQYIRSKFPAAVNKQIDEHGDANALLRGLRAVLNDRGLCDAKGIGKIKMTPKTRRLLARARSLRNANRRRLNRLLLADAYPGLISPNPTTGARHVKDLFKDFFYSVLYNSADFQLAGYSFDLCLCDLSKVGALREHIDRLAVALKSAMAGDPGLAPDTVPLARELVLLAHWDAQSFWQDNYTDLYDFCYRLSRRCKHVFSWKGEAMADSPQFALLRDIRKHVFSLKGEEEMADSPQFAVLRDIIGAGEKMMEAIADSPQFVVLRNLIEACEKMTDALKRGLKGDDDRVVVRAEFAGAEYQYSHGLSIYFPWSRPADGFFEDKYRKYKFGETVWSEFLDEYFTKTRRESFGQENPELASRARSAKDRTQAAILESLLREIGTRVFTDGQLAKGAGNDATGKGAGNDASGDCDCSSVKNYPPFTGNPEGHEAEGDNSPVKGEFSPHFHDQVGRSAK